jgi:hypothetical protein
MEPDPSTGPKIADVKNLDAAAGAPKDSVPPAAVPAVMNALERAIRQQRTSSLRENHAPAMFDSPLRARLHSANGLNLQQAHAEQVATRTRSQKQDVKSQSFIAPTHGSNYEVCEWLSVGGASSSRSGTPVAKREATSSSTVSDISWSARRVPSAAMRASYHSSRLATFDFGHIPTQQHSPFGGVPKSEDRSFASVVPPAADASRASARQPSPYNAAQTPRTNYPVSMTRMNSGDLHASSTTHAASKISPAAQGGASSASPPAGESPATKVDAKVVARPGENVNTIPAHAKVEAYDHRASSVAAVQPPARVDEKRSASTHQSGSIPGQSAGIVAQATTGSAQPQIKSEGASAETGTTTQPAHVPTTTTASSASKQDMQAQAPQKSTYSIPPAANILNGSDQPRAITSSQVDSQQRQSHDTIQPMRAQLQDSFSKRSVPSGGSWSSHSVMSGSMRSIQQDAHRRRRGKCSR